MDLNTLLGAVSKAIAGRTGQAPDVDTNGFLGEVTDLFRQHGQATNQTVDDQYAQRYQGQYPGPAPDQDPYQQYQGQEQVLPASMDPLGDPADQDQYQGQTVLPASEDPLGDPADEQPQQQQRPYARY